MSQQWYFEKKDLRNTPSLQTGVDSKQEARYRREGAQFITDLGRSMQLSLTTIATGVVYFHRFYMKHSFKDFPRYPTCCACIFLAGKVEETPKKCKDIIKYARIVLPDIKFAQFQPGVKNPYEEVMTLESILLKTIKFGIEVVHPHTFILKYAKSFKGEKNKLQKMVQMAWVFANDSLRTTLCLQWQPEIIAIALIHLAGKLSRFDIIDWDGKTIEHCRWWDMFVEYMTIDILEDICHQVLDLYCDSQNTTPCESPPPFPCPSIPIISTHDQAQAAMSSSPLKNQSTRIQIAGSSKMATPVVSMTSTTYGTPGPSSEVTHPPSTPLSKAIQSTESQRPISVSSRSLYQNGKRRTESECIPTTIFSRKKSCYPPSPLLASTNGHKTPPAK